MRPENGLLKCDEMIGQFVEIMLKSKIIDRETGREISYGKTAFFRGCDGLFLYYSLDPGKNAELSGFVPVVDVMDVVRVDHMEDLMGDENEEVDDDG
jgi:hypothetical protein